MALTLRWGTVTAVNQRLHELVRCEVDGSSGRAGDSLTLGVRPEHWVVGGAHNRLEVQVTFVEQLGSTTGDEAQKAELVRIQKAAAYCARVGLECHAGHGLNYENVAPIAAIPNVRELNIGHFLIGEAIFGGLDSAVRGDHGHPVAAGRPHTREHRTGVPVGRRDLYLALPGALQLLLDARNRLDQRQLEHRLRVVGHRAVGVDGDGHRAHAEEAERHQAEREDRRGKLQTGRHQTRHGGVIRQQRGAEHQHQQGDAGIAAEDGMEMDGDTRDAEQGGLTQVEQRLAAQRTQLQDAVPMTLGQEFATFARMTMEDEQRLREVIPLLCEINLGGTAIGNSLRRELLGRLLICCLLEWGASFTPQAISTMMF